MRACMHVCLPACLRVCVRANVRTCMRAYACACVLMFLPCKTHIWAAEQLNMTDYFNPYAIHMDQKPGLIPHRQTLHITPVNKRRKQHCALTDSQILSNSGSHEAARWQFCSTTHVPFSTACNSQRFSQS